MRVRAGRSQSRRADARIDRTWRAVVHSRPYVPSTSICEAAAPFTLHNTTVTGVPLQPNGDFVIDDVLTPAPAACASPVLLIRNVAGTWFAAGIPVVDMHRN